MYYGAVDVPHEYLDDFLSTAKSLEIKGLADDVPDSLSKDKVGSALQFNADSSN